MHKFWRIYITGNNSSDYTTVGRLQFRAVAGGTDQCTDGVRAIASANTGWAYAAFGDDPAAWQTTPGVPCWIGYHFADPVQVTEVALTGDPSYFATRHPEQAPREFQVQYSDDGALWVTASYVFGQTGWGMDETRTFTVPLALDEKPYAYPTVDRFTGLPLPNPSRPLNYGQKLSTLNFEADSGHSQRRVKAQPKATFEFAYNALKKTEYQTIRDFFLLVMNVYPFYWTDPIEKVRYAVVFNQDTFVGSQKGHGPAGPWYSLDIKLIQTWDEP